MSRFIASIVFLFSSFSHAYVLPPFKADNVPIIDFVEWISEEAKVNIIVASGVDGTMSAHMTNLDSRDLISFFKNSMKANGLIVEKNGSSYEISVSKDDAVPLVPLVSKVYTLTNVKNLVVVDLISRLLAGNQVDGIDDDQTVTQNAIVDALISTNGILVSASRNQLGIIEKFLPELDKPQRQILIEAIILESDLSNAESFAVNLSSVIPTNGFAAISNTLSTASAAGNLGLGGSIVFNNNAQIQDLVTALISESNTKILSKPNILVLDREQAVISVGQTVPFLLSNEITDGGNSIQQITREDVGISLTVVPHVINNQKVVLNIIQESSSVSESSVASDLITNKRSVSTVINMFDGQTVALGGLVSEESRTKESGVPFFKDIPWIGSLFRKTSTELIQRELTVMFKATFL